MDHIGIDVHTKESQLCILSEDGERRESRVRTTPARFADVLGARSRARILLEASTESETSPLGSGPRRAWRGSRRRPSRSRTARRPSGSSGSMGG